MILVANQQELLAECKKWKALLLKSGGAFFDFQGITRCDTKL